VVGGVELDFSVTDIKGSAAPAVLNLNPTQTETRILSDDVKYLGTLRTRLGFSDLFGSGCCGGLKPAAWPGSASSGQRSKRP